MTAAALLAQFGNVPVVSVYKSGAAQTGLTSGTGYQFTMANVEYDSASGYSTANSRYTAPVSGYYQVTGFGSATVSTGQIGFVLYIKKNGVGTRLSMGIDITGNITATLTVTGIVYMAAGDYIELWGTPYGASPQLNANAWMQAVLVRGV